MNDSADSVEQVLRDELARGDAVLADARPILRYLLAQDGHPLLSEATVAHVRGMMFDLAAQLLHAEADAGEVQDRVEHIREGQGDLAAALIEDGALPAHAQALVLEARLAERLHTSNGIDPVLPALVQELAGGADGPTAELAMALLAAQARFMQQCRRMELPLRELPGDLFHAALMALRARGGIHAAAAERRLREGFDESAGRLALIARTVIGMAEDSSRAFAIDQAGVALFATALAMASQQDRDQTVLSFCEGQFARLLLAMRAAGLDQRAVERQLVFLHPDRNLPAPFQRVSPEQAVVLLASRGVQ